MEKEDIKKQYRQIQEYICNELVNQGIANPFKEDTWERKEGGGGFTRVTQKGVIEKGGVNFSAVHGKTPNKILKALKLDAADFFATGVSIVLHPQNPFCPIIHMNIRYFEMSNGIYWFGGGIDLTPHYITDTDDAKYFHASLQKICDRFNPSAYQEYKKWADEYFYLPHREETRGVGGIFYDRLSENNQNSKKEILDFSLELGKAFPKIYAEIIHKNKNKLYYENHKKWQRLRRSRYVEFNLVYDKGTKFGLETNGRTESILMSMPPTADWEYCYEPEENSAEALTQSYLKKAQGFDWLNS